MVQSCKVRTESVLTEINCKKQSLFSLGACLVLVSTCGIFQLKKILNKV